MPVSNHLRRLLTGFDGTSATPSDGAAGRPAVTLTPTVTIVDDDTILIEAILPFADSFDETIKEVYVQFRGASSFTPIGRFTTRPITKTTTNELVIQIVIEVA